MSNKFINLTPHEVTILSGSNTILIPPSGIVARCSTVISPLPSAFIGNIEIKINKSSLGDIIGLPPKQEGTYYITSIIVAQKGKQIDRDDLLAPDTIRDDQGNVIGCKGFLIP